VSDVAERLRVSARTVASSAFLRRVGLRRLKLGGRLTRFNPDDVDAAIERLTKGGL
jgi:excisionase family DNA binding protein